MHCALTSIPSTIYAARHVILANTIGHFIATTLIDLKTSMFEFRTLAQTVWVSACSTLKPLALRGSMQLLNNLNIAFATWQRWGGGMDFVGEIGDCRRSQVCIGDRKGTDNSNAKKPKVTSQLNGCCKPVCGISLSLYSR